MIAHQLALIKREFWEHRSIWVTPIAIGLVISVATLTGQMSISAYGGEVDLGIAALSNTDEMHRRIAIMAMMGAVTGVFSVGAAIVMIFYSLDTLYSERKDKSILFWRSLPLTDAEQVISKLLTIALVIPAVALGVTFLTHLVVMAISSIWLMAEGANPGHLIWSSAPIFDVWFANILIALAMTLWFSPFFGWFLFVSAYTKRSPLLMSMMPIIVLPLIEIALLPTELLARAVWGRFRNVPISGIDFDEIMEGDNLSALRDMEVSWVAALDMGRFFSSPSMWAGLVVCGLFVATAIYVRRFKDES